MIEKTILDYLSERVEVPAYMQVPENQPEAFLVIEKLGGGMENHIFSAVISVEAYGPSLYAAASLNEQVKGAMLYGPLPNEITRVRLNSDYNYTDPTTKQCRYRAVFDITHYQ